MKKATKNLIYLFSTSALILSAGSTAFAQDELANTPYTLSDHQFNINRCDNIRRDDREVQRDFIAACTTAGLGSSIDICTERLEDCSGEGSKDKSYCLGTAISTADADKVDTRLDSLYADREDAAMDAVDLVKRKSEITATLEKTLREIEEAKINAFEAEVTKMNQITDAVAGQYDKLSTLQLQMRQFVLNKSVACHGEAAQVKADYVAERKRRAANGQKSHLTQSQLISRTGLSVNEASVLKYNRHMRNCTATGTKKGKQTIFAKQYKFQKATINNQKRIIKREIKRLNAQRINVKKERKRALLKLDRVKASAFAEASRALQNINAEQIALAAKGSRIDDSIFLETAKLIKNDKSSGSVMNNALIALASNRINLQTSSKKRTIASEPKMEAFTTANSLLLEIEDADRNDADCSTLNDHSDIANSQAPIITAEVIDTEAESCTDRGATATRACASVNP